MIEFMNEQLAFRKLLLKKYEEQRIKNPHISRREFSKGIGLSAGAISEIFNGQRKVSVKLARRVVQKLGLDPQERVNLIKVFEKRAKRPRRVRPSSKPAVDPNYLRVSADQFRVIGDWYHFAILALMKTQDFKSDIAWIADRLGLNVTAARTAVERLKRLALVREDESGNLTASGVNHCTPDDISNASIRLAHFELMVKARQALEALSVEERDITAFMLNLSPAQLPRAKEMIRKFQDDLAAEFETQPQSDVYQLCIQLFPLTQIKKDWKKSQ